MRRKLLFFVLAFALCLPILQAQTANGSTAAVGINASALQVTDKQIVMIEVDDPTASSAYGVSDDAGTTWEFNGTANADGDSMYFYYTVDGDAGDTITLTLYPATGAASATVNLEVYDPIPYDWLMEIFMDLLPVIIVIGIFVAIRKSMTGNKD